jgi:putative ABC transport system permease protein
MFRYYLLLAVYSLKRSRIITTLMILAIGLGIGASMTMITVLHVMSGDPLPERSAQLYVPFIDPLPVSNDSKSKNAPSEAEMTWVDAMNLLHAARAERQAAMAAGTLPVRPPQATLRPFFENGHYVTADFFPMFGTTFRNGSGWTTREDAEHARVVVLNAELNRKLFGDASGVGQTVRLENTDFRVIGVLNNWNPQPAFYARIDSRAFGNTDQFFIPLETAQELNFDFHGRFACWGDGGDNRTSDHCTWLQFWVQLSDAAKVRAYRDYLADYWREQQSHGRFPRPVNAQLYGLMDWLVNQHVVPDDLHLQLWLAIGFLGVCMVNIIGPLLAKFLRRSGEISVRRALGARKRDIFLQLGIESAVIGIAGGTLGLMLAEFGLWTVRQRPDGYAKLAQMDPGMLLATFALAVVASVLAGLLPAWRACHVTPALQLKTQ